jgi:GNAT superfamily N-acetyltransferase
MPTEAIRVAETPEDQHAFGSLVHEYIDWVRERFSDKGALVDAFFSHQGLEEEIANFATSYTFPNGLALIAYQGADAVGCGAFRRLDETTCEMKRVFVSTRHQRHGAGRRLCQKLIARAKDQSFKLMRLDTDNRSFEATGLYESLGFVYCEPYVDYPPEYKPYMLFMELDLRKA